MNKTFLKIAFAWTLVLAMTASAVAESTYHYDSFERPNSTTLGPDWIEQWGDWEIQSNKAVPVRTDPSPNQYTVAIYTGTDTGEEPYVVQMDSATIGQGAWTGLAFNIDPENPGNFYALSVRGAHDSNPCAAQFRRYVNGVRSVRNELTGLFEPHTITRHHYWRYRVVSPGPGVYLLSILRLDQETREPVEILWEQRVEDTVHPWGGQAGLYTGLNLRIENFLVAHHQEVRPVDLALRGAVELEFLARPERLYQPQVLEGGDWVNHGPPILGRGEVTTLRFPREDAAEVRIVTSPE